MRIDEVPSTDVLRRVLLGVGVAGLLGYVAVCGLLYQYQRVLLYRPVSAAADTPTTTRIFRVGNERLRISVAEVASNDALIYFGGNGEDVSRALPQLRAAFPSRALYLMHYRGYGGSSGVPTELGLQSDGLALFDWVGRRHPQVLVVGRSLGTGIAVRIAALRPVQKLLLLTPYDSIENVAAERFPFAPMALLLHDKYQSAALAPRVRAPTLVIVAEHDEVIPRARTDALVRAFKHGVADVRVLLGATHNVVLQRPDCVALMRALN